MGVAAARRCGYFRTQAVTKPRSPRCASQHECRSRSMSAEAPAPRQLQKPWPRRLVVSPSIRQVLEVDPPLSVPRRSLGRDPRHLLDLRRGLPSHLGVGVVAAAQLTGGRKSATSTNLSCAPHACTADPRHHGAYAGRVNETASSQPENASVAADPHTAGEMLELGRAECLRLLAEGTVGRIAVNEPHRPQPVIRPVNYVFDEPSQSVLYPLRVWVQAVSPALHGEGSIRDRRHRPGRPSRLERDHPGRHRGDYELGDPAIP